jgi:hypothetical protein
MTIYTIEPQPLSLEAVYALPGVQSSARWPIARQKGSQGAIRGRAAVLELLRSHGPQASRVAVVELLAAERIVAPGVVA